VTKIGKLGKTLAVTKTEASCEKILIWSGPVDKLRGDNGFDDEVTRKNLNTEKLKQKV
jgi:hypothetical protein